VSDNQPKTQPRLDAVDPIVKTAVAADINGSHCVLLLCPLAEEYLCVRGELTRHMLEDANRRGEMLRLRMPMRMWHEPPRNALRFFGETSFVVVQSGIGKRTLQFLEGFPELHFKAVCLLGFAGALDPSLKVGDTIEPEHLRDGQYGDRVALNPIGVADRHEGIVTINDIASTPTDKRSLRRQFDCYAVDMEAFPLAKACEAHGIPFHTARSISDAADEEFPKELNGVILPFGDLSIKRLIWAVMKKPTLVKPLYRLWKNNRKAKDGLRLITRRLVEALA
jgi:nucleoside phosphorylase